MQIDFEDFELNFLKKGYKSDLTNLGFSLPEVSGFTWYRWQQGALTFDPTAKLTGCVKEAANALWVEFAQIDASDLVSTSPLSHSRTSPQAERRAAERNGAQRSGALLSERVSERVALLNDAVFSIIDHSVVKRLIFSVVCLRLLF